jgi:hypothetical protein
MGWVPRLGPRSRCSQTGVQIDTTSTQTELDAEFSADHGYAAPAASLRSRGPDGATTATAMAYFPTDALDAAAGEEQRKLATVDAVSLSAR